MENKIIIGIDIDNTINNFSELFIVYLETLTGFKLTVEDIDDFNLEKVINKVSNGTVNGKIAYNIYENEGFLMDLELLDNVKSVLRKISNDNRVQVKLVTAISNPKLFSIRDRWIKNKLGDLNIEVVYENNKQKIKMNYLIDDAPHNLDNVSKLIGVDNCICINHLYNKHVNYPKASTLEDAINYVYKKECFI